MKPRIQPIYVVPDVRTNYISIQFPEWFENAREPQCKRSRFSLGQVSSYFVSYMLVYRIHSNQQHLGPYLLVCVFTACLPQLECKPMGAGPLMVSFTLVCTCVLSCADFVWPHGLSMGILEWVAISYSRGSSQLKDQTSVSCISR